MSAYLVARLKVENEEKYNEYRQLAGPALAKYGGRILSRGERRILLEGENDDFRTVICEFDNIEQGQEFYASPEYQHAISFRENAVQIQIILIDGV